MDSKRIMKIFAVAVCIVAVTACIVVVAIKAYSNQNQKVEKSAQKMDTIMTLTAYGTNASEAIDAAYKRIDEIEQMASSSISTSDVSQINDAAGEGYVKVHSEILKMIKTAVKYSKLSDGAFDITVSPLIKLWGIGTDDERIPSDSEIEAILRFVGYNNISINEQDSSIKLMNKGMSIDLGGIAKGFAADEVVKIFKEYGIKSAIISLGGSTIYTIGNKTNGGLWSIAIENPRSTESESYLGVINMSEKALSTSGDYERYFIKDGKRYCHIFNPFTGYPADSGVMSDTIVIDSDVTDCNMLADICTKIVFVYGVEKGFKIIDNVPGVACMAVTTDYQVYESSNWNLQIDDLDSKFKIVN